MQGRLERPRSLKSLTGESKRGCSSRVTEILRDIDRKSYFKDFKQSLHHMIQNYKQEGRTGFGTESKERPAPKKAMRKASTAKNLLEEPKRGESAKQAEGAKSRSTRSLAKTTGPPNGIKPLSKPRQSQGQLQRTANSRSKPVIESVSRNLLDMKRLVQKNGGHSNKRTGLVAGTLDRPTVKISTPMFIKAVSKKSAKKPVKKAREARLDEYVTKLKEPNEETETVKMLRSSITFDRDTFNSDNDAYYMHELHIALGKPGKLSPAFEQLFKVHFNQTIQSLMFFKNLQLKSYTYNGLEVKLGPKAHNRKTLVFDLDETLIHCNADQSGPADIRLPVTFPNGETIMAGINVRPHAREILVDLSKHFEIVVFTASHSCYANPVVDFLDTEKVVNARLYRENCSQVTDGLYTKDLSVFSDRELKDIILVDNAVYSFVMQLGNGIPIIPFYDNKSDKELLKLKKFLLGLKAEADVRDKINAHFKWHNFLRYAFDPEQLLAKLSK